MIYVLFRSDRVILLPRRRPSGQVKSPQQRSSYDLSTEAGMKSNRLARLASGALLVLFSVAASLLAAPSGYHLLRKYSFGAAEGSTREYFDYISIDSAARRVYLSHGTEIKVIDADTGTLITNITGLKQTHGVAIAADFGRGFISDGAQGKAIIFDLQTLKVTGEAKADKDADSIVYDPYSKRVFVMNGDPHTS